MSTDTDIDIDTYLRRLWEIKAMNLFHPPLAAAITAAMEEPSQFLLERVEQELVTAREFQSRVETFSIPAGRPWHE